MYSRKLRGPSLFFLSLPVSLSQLRGHPCCASWMVVNHFESDVSITVALLFFFPTPSALDKWGFRCFQHCSVIHKSCVFSNWRGLQWKMASDLLAVCSISPPWSKMVSLKKGLYTPTAHRWRKMWKIRRHVRARVLLKLVVNYTCPLISLPLIMSLSSFYFISSHFLQPSFCCSTWFSTVSWPACSPWPCGCCCSPWMTTCPSTETACPIQVSVSQHTAQGEERGFQQLCNWQHFSLRHPLFILTTMRCCHNNVLHNSCFLYRSILKSLPDNSSVCWMENVFCPAVIGDKPCWWLCISLSPVGITYCFTLCLLCFMSLLQGWWSAQIHWTSRSTNLTPSSTRSTSNTWSPSCKVSALLPDRNDQMHVKTSSVLLLPDLLPVIHPIYLNASLLVSFRI